MPTPLHQYMTPIWAAEALVERYFSDLNTNDMVIEPSCGTGAFLRAIPDSIPALGVEIDPVLADVARQHSGREVLTGDFCSVPLPAFTLTPTTILGNPPFAVEVIDRFLNRAATLLPDGGRVGFVLPAYCFQTARRVVDYAATWSLRQDLIPRNLFPGLSTPLVFALFSKDRRRTLIGFALYDELAEIQAMPAVTQQTLTASPRPGSVWRQAVEAAIQRLGGEADLQALYDELGPRRPTATTHWKEKVLQTVQRYCLRTGPARYALAA